MLYVSSLMLSSTIKFYMIKHFYHFIIHVAQVVIATKPMQ